MELVLVARLVHDRLVDLVPAERVRIASDGLAGDGQSTTRVRLDAVEPGTSHEVGASRTGRRW